MKYLFPVVFILFSLMSCHNNEEEDNSEDNSVVRPVTLGYTVTNIYPHDTTSFTEGLEWHDSTLYESTGNYGPSKLARVDLKTGKDIQKVSLSKEYFGEGLTALDGKLYQLTYHEHKCFIYDFKTFKKTGEFSYAGDGWGMTNDGKYLVMDSGSNILFFRDPATFKIVKTLPVTGVPVITSEDQSKSEIVYINELEYIDGFIYANVWNTNFILKIDASSGKVVAKADLGGILETYTSGTLPEKMDVLNGIAYDKTGKRFFITGKWWPKVFEIKFN
jgi:glutamine cyclotransferase